MACRQLSVTAGEPSASRPSAHSHPVAPLQLKGSEVTKETVKEAFKQGVRSLLRLPPKRFPKFMSLPLELRNKIYGIFLFGGDGENVTLCVRLAKTKVKQPSQTKNPLVRLHQHLLQNSVGASQGVNKKPSKRRLFTHIADLFLTNSTVKTEAEAVFYRHTMLISSTATSALTKLCHNTRDLDACLRDRIIQYLLSPAPCATKIRHVTLRITDLRDVPMSAPGMQFIDSLEPDPLTSDLCKKYNIRYKVDRRFFKALTFNLVSALYAPCLQTIALDVRGAAWPSIRASKEIDLEPDHLPTAKVVEVCYQVWERHRENVVRCRNTHGDGVVGENGLGFVEPDMAILLFGGLGLPLPEGCGLRKEGTMVKWGYGNIERT
ncbi:hypothetical protein BCR34DRAFT_602007 [Clohesyomyces aquaticus]|uniref:F-box domain-containing protein n=1 Tax=Clohesyomyces aquaticus TaxID=1231657 RepID=A0A1Y1ZKK4_9PLEO|nr:hypothetical protein BCR34DRAFT_602007 [Clohesyomyces aquaticus]